ncbi:MAG: SDR family NAD(P)-dependent oxidoreductase, partial [Thiolinea sp.]
MLNNRVAIVTGGLQGIGLAIVKALHQQGAKVAVGARRGDDPEASAEARQIVGEHGMVAALDVRSTNSVNTFVADVAEKLGNCDILVNAAGISVHHIVSNHPDTDWEAVIDTNLNG